MIVWGGYDGDSFEHRREIQSQHRQLDSHQHHQRARCPRAHTAVWTGSEMIVWGGSSTVIPFLTLAGDIIPAPTVGQPLAPLMRPLAEVVTRQCGPAAK